MSELLRRLASIWTLENTSVVERVEKRAVKQVVRTAFPELAEALDGCAMEAVRVKCREIEDLISDRGMYD